MRYELVTLLQLRLKTVDRDFVMVQLLLELVVVNFCADLLHVNICHLALVEFLVANFRRNMLH